MNIQRIEKLMIITYPETNKRSDQGKIIEIESKDRNCCFMGLSLDEQKAFIEYLIMKYEHNNKVGWSKLLGAEK